MEHTLKAHSVGGAESLPPLPAAGPRQARGTEEALGTAPQGDRLQPVGQGVDSGMPPRRGPEPQPCWGAEPACTCSLAHASQTGPLTQDWVCEPQQSRRPQRHWSLSIDERRQRALRGSSENQDSELADVQQAVARLVSQDVSPDALLPHPLRVRGASNAFRAFLARSAPFWQKMASEAPRPPPS
ncbi:Testis-expressed protein 22 [Galemys pyrenaicus]|uniref:Testis-expressed protein 22 n=1 Tax=Galemys pyrenaicus TaxID=202257 RepID=A0A8J6AMS3_GALPY|nr:Testis-expressed protein 22 [Galemys pyrenaicus]